MADRLRRQATCFPNISDSTDLESVKTLEAWAPGVSLFAFPFAKVDLVLELLLPLLSLLLGQFLFGSCRLTC